jgi:hypothetical protein
MKSKSEKQLSPAENDSFSTTTIAALLFLAAKFPHRQFNSAELCILSGIGRTAMSQIKKRARYAILAREMHASALGRMACKAPRI